MLLKEPPITPISCILVHITQLQSAQSGFLYDEIQLEEDLWKHC